MNGYWNDPDATTITIKNGWVNTGNIGKIDNEGYLIITDRKKDIIVNAGGDNISPSRIEEKLNIKPEISQSMIYGEIIYFFQSYINSFLFLIMMTAMMIHAKLGCETIVQDYVTSASSIKTLKIIINFITLMSLLLSLFAIVKIGIL